MDIILDLKTVNLSKEDFISLLMDNRLFTTLSDLFDERREEDEDFFVFSLLLLFHLLFFLFKNY